jgi:hypothetical protein
LWGSHRVDGVPALVAAAAPVMGGGGVGWGLLSSDSAPDHARRPWGWSSWLSPWWSPALGLVVWVWLGGTLLLPVTDVRIVPVRAPGPVKVCGVVGGGCGGGLVHAVGS